MGRGSSKAGGGGGGGGSANDAANATTMNDAEAWALVQQENLTPAQAKAVKDYISNTNFDGNGHSLSQTMNYLADQGVDLNTATAAEINRKYGTFLSDSDVAQMRTVDRELNSAMHPLGRPTILERGAHDDMLKDTFGINDYSQMSLPQLQNALVGKAYKNTANLSTAYDKNKNPFTSPSSPVSGGREVIYNMKVGSGTNVVFGAKRQSEVIIGKGTNFRITGVSYSGKMAYPRSGSPRQQIIIDVETF